MNLYLVYSGGLHLLAALGLMFILAQGAKQSTSATYTIDFIGSGKVQAVTAPTTTPKPTVAAPVPAPEAVAKPTPTPDKKAYVSKTEIAEKSQPVKKKKTVVAPLEAPSILEETPGDAAGQEGEFSGSNIATDFANFPYPWYITQVRNSLWSEWEKRRPVGNVLTTLVSFAIARDGKIKNLKVVRSSSDDTFDFAATSAVINAGPFGPLPMLFEKDELTVTVEFKQEK